MDSDQEKVDNEEIFFLAFNAFIRDLEALSQSPEKVCELEGYYNVAGEFWYLLPNDYLLENSLGLFSEAQLSALKKLFESIKGLPEETIKWTNVAEESLQNMSRPEWGVIRQQARELRLLLAPIVKFNNEYFSQ